MTLNKHSAEAFEGEHSGMLPDGTKFSGKIIGRMKDKDHFEWEFKGKTSSGEEQTMIGKFTRKSN